MKYDVRERGGGQPPLKWWDRRERWERGEGDHYNPPPPLGEGEGEQLNLGEG